MSVCAETSPKVVVTVRKYAGFVLSLLDRVLAPMTEPVGLRAARPRQAPERDGDQQTAATQSVAAVVVETVTTAVPSVRNESLAVANPPHQGSAVSARADDEKSFQQGRDFFVAKPRKDKRRPGKPSFRYVVFKPGGVIPDGCYLARREGRRYVPVGTNHLSTWRTAS